MFCEELSNYGGLVCSVQHELQHHWLKFLSKQLGLTDALLPRHVESFRLLGSRAVFAEGRSIDDFWYRLSGLARESDGEQLLNDDTNTFRARLTMCFNHGETQTNGERVLRFGSGFIRLPKRFPGRANRSRSVLLPTKFGRYRLKRDLFNNMDPVIQLSEEVPGLPIARPPEGWDDLGAGGADVRADGHGEGKRGQQLKGALLNELSSFTHGQHGVYLYQACISSLPVVAGDECLSGGCVGRPVGGW